MLAFKRLMLALHPDNLLHSELVMQIFHICGRMGVQISQVALCACPAIPVDLCFCGFML